MDQAENSAKTVGSGLETIFGKHFSDGWTSPYISFAVAGTSLSATALELKVFRPAVIASNVKQSVLVRSGLHILDRFEFAKSGNQMIVRNISLVALDKSEQLVFSIRVFPPARPTLPDARVLGLVLLGASLI